MKTRLWTVVRFPDGSWSYGGRMDDPAYELCEKWRIEATSGEDAKKLAQAKRRSEQAKAKRASARGVAS